jgi:hypothetical protein
MYNTYCFSRATLLRERVPLLRYTYAACLFNTCEPDQVSDQLILRQKIFLRNTQSLCVEISCNLWNPQVNRHVHKSPLLAPILNQLYPLQIFAPCSSDSVSCVPSVYFQVPRILWPQRLVRSLALLMYAISPAHFVIPYLLALALCDGHELWSSLCHILIFCVT